jgi:hypothetical protein
MLWPFGFTLDADFGIYRLRGRGHFELLPG